MANGFNVSALNAYIDESSLEQVTKALLKPVTIADGGISLHPDVIKSKDVHTMSQDVIFREDTGCGLNTTGATNFDKVTLTAKDFILEAAYCNKDLEGVYLQTQLRMDAQDISIPGAIEEQMVNHRMAQVGGEIEKIIWKSNTSSGSGNLAIIDGYLAKLDALSGSTINTSRGTFNKSTALAKVDDYAATIPSELQGLEVYVYMGMDDFNAYRIAATDNVGNTLEAVDVMGNVIPNAIKHRGSELIVKGVTGLNGTSTMVIAESANLHYGYNGDVMSMEFIEDRITRNVYERIQFSAGVAVTNADQIVVVK